MSVLLQKGDACICTLNDVFDVARNQKIPAASRTLASCKARLKPGRLLAAPAACSSTSARHCRATLVPMPTASYEFTSFRAALDSHQNSPRAKPGKSAAPWVPGGVGEKHIKSRGLPSKPEKEAAAVEAARADAAAEREALHERLDATSASMDKFDARLSSIVEDFEEHMVASTAASVLVAKRLGQLRFLT